MDGATAGRPVLDAGLGMYVAQLRLLEGVSVPLEAIGGKSKKGVVPYLPGNLQLGPCISSMTAALAGNSQGGCSSWATTERGY